MTDQKEIPIRDAMGLCPLFVDVGVDITCMSKFKWKGTNFVSYFPTMVQPRNFKNVSVAVENADERPPSVKFGKAKVVRLEDFDPCSYEAKEPTVILSSGFEKHNSEISLKLNAMGIGIFTLKDQLEPISRGDGKEVVITAPYSIEMVNRLIYSPEEGDDDWDSITFVSLEMLLFPLRPTVTSNLKLDKFRDRFIYQHMMLNNPPSNLNNDSLEPVGNTEQCQGKWVVARKAGSKINLLQFDGKNSGGKSGVLSFSVPFVNGVAKFLWPTFDVALKVDGIQVSRQALQMMKSKISI